MTVTVIPASSKVCRAAIDALLQDDNAPEVIGVYRNLDKVPKEFAQNPKFKAVKGNPAEVESLDFSGSQTVLTLTPPIYDGSMETVQFATLFATSVRSAIQNSGSVQRLVYISSGGAQYASGVGEIKSNHTCEEIFKGAAKEMVFIRPTYFMENWAPALDSIRDQTPYFDSSITPVDFKMEMVATKDIGRIAAAKVQKTGAATGSEPAIVDLYGPEAYSVEDVQRALSSLIGKDVKIRPVQPEHLADFFGSFLPPSLVDNFVEMTRGLLPGGILVRDTKEKMGVVRGVQTLLETFKEMGA